MLVILIDKNGKRCELNVENAELIGVIYTDAPHIPYCGGHARRVFRYNGSVNGRPLFVETEPKEISTAQLNFK